MNYAALGATINLASRLEGLNKNYGTRVLVGTAVRASVGDRFLFRSVDSITPKGFADAIEVVSSAASWRTPMKPRLRCARRFGMKSAAIAQDGAWRSETTRVRLSALPARPSQG